MTRHITHHFTDGFGFSAVVRVPITAADDTLSVVAYGQDEAGRRATLSVLDALCAGARPSPPVRYETMAEHNARNVSEIRERMKTDPVAMAFFGPMFATIPDPDTASSPRCEAGMAGV